MADDSQLFTKVVTGTTFTLPAGAKEIFLKNNGAGIVTWKGTKKLNADVSDPIPLQPSEAFSYPYIGVGRGEITFDATAGILLISAYY